MEVPNQNILDMSFEFSIKKHRYNKIGEIKDSEIREFIFIFHMGVLF